MKRGWTGILVVFAFMTIMSSFSGKAWAQHAPTRVKMSETIVIHASPERVWARLQNFADMSWHPGIVSCTAAPGNALDTSRLIVLKSGGEISETLYRYDAAKMMYATLVPHMDLKVLPVSTYSSYIFVRPGPDPQTTAVEWRAAFYRGYPNNNPPKELNEEAGKRAVGVYARQGLEGLKAAVESGS